MTQFNLAVRQIQNRNNCNSWKRKFCNTISLIFFLLVVCQSYAKEHTTYTNILTWWGYLDDMPSSIKRNIESQCHTKLSYDNYYSNDEFLNRFNDRTFHYDIIIFSDTIYKGLEKKINIPSSQLYFQSKTYNSDIKNHYLKSNFDHNVVYFLHSLTGFLYNQNVIDISPQDNVSTIFKKAKNNIVIMIDDPLEANFLIRRLLKKSPKNNDICSPSQNYLTWDNFQSVFQNSHIIITNSPQKISTFKNFAFAFQWSGDALTLLERSDNKLKFLVHPKLSYISTDLLAELNTEKTTSCVAKYLLNSNFISYLQNRDKYFSPYGEKSNISSPEFKNFIHQTFLMIPSLPWISSLNSEELLSLKKSWEYIKFKVQEQEKLQDD